MDVRTTDAAVWEHALVIFGSAAKAEGWFHTPLAELHDRTPEKVLLTEGSEPIETILGRIEYGVFN
jgi:putative toxin-antitoxin system antitoxin component (TIGR02293 family)